MRPYATVCGRLCDRVRPCTVVCATVCGKNISCATVCDRVRPCSAARMAYCDEKLLRLIYLTVIHLLFPNKPMASLESMLTFSYPF